LSVGNYQFSILSDSECKGTTFRGNSQYQEIVILYQYNVVCGEKVTFFY